MAGGPGECLHLLITGQTRSGKTTLTRLLIKSASRVVALDRLGDYSSEVRMFDKFSASVDYFTRRRAGAFRVGYRGNPAEGETAFRAWLHLIRVAQEADPTLPIAVIMEEAHHYSTTHTIAPELEALYLWSGRWRVNLVSVVQRDVQLHPIVRANSICTVAMRNSMIGDQLARLFSREDQKRIPQLEQLRPGVKPVYGRHYLTAPPEFPLWAEWRRLNNW